MNQELQKQLASLIEKASQAGQSAWDFASAQAPELIHQILVWKFWENVFSAVFFAMIIAALSFPIRKAIYEGKKSLLDREEGWIILGILSAIASVLLMVGVFTSTLTAIKIKLAPKVYIVEYIMEMTKTK